MIKNTEQALFCLLSPSQDEGEQMNYCKNCKYAEMCGRVVAVIVEYKDEMAEKAEGGGKSG